VVSKRVDERSGGGGGGGIEGWPRKRSERVEYHYLAKTSNKGQQALMAILLMSLGT